MKFGVDFWSGKRFKVCFGLTASSVNTKIHRQTGGSASAVQGCTKSSTAVLDAADDTAEHLRDCTWLGRHATHVWTVSDKHMCVTGRCQSAHGSRPTEPSVEIPS